MSNGTGVFFERIRFSIRIHINMSDTIKIEITSDHDLLWRHWDKDYADDHAGQVYSVSGFTHDGWAIVDGSQSKCRHGNGAKFHPCCFNPKGIRAFCEYFGNE